MAETSPSPPLAEEAIISKIYMIRGQKVMLDHDLAALYKVETKRLKQQVNRNLERFPPHFMFELTQEENEILRSQFVTSSWGGRRLAPYAFTEHGLLMLSNVLKSSQAITMSIKIIDVFVKMREMLLTHKDILLKLEQLENQAFRNTKDIKVIFDRLKQFLIPPEQSGRQRIGFKSPDP